MLPSLSGRLEAEVAIVGGGLGGLATALSLAERGSAAVLLEAGQLGDGATGRCGGMVSAGFARATAALEAKLGLDHTLALQRESVAALALIRGRIERHRIACAPVDGVVVASFFADAAAFRAELGRLASRYGMRLDYLPRDRLRALCATPRYTHGALDPDGFHLDPLALARGYARAAMAGGARLFERSPVRALGRDRAGWRLDTEGGSVHARTVVLATSAYGDALLPRLRRAVVPVVTYIIVTAPLGDRLQQVIRAPYAVFDDRFATGYYRPVGDGRLLWGGRVSLREAPPDIAGLMRRDLAQIYPQLADVPIAFAWAGRMGFARHKMPLLGELEPGLWVTTAFGGHGLNTTTMGGELVAAAIVEGDRRWQLFAPFAPLPVHGLAGKLAVQAIYWGSAARDAARIAWQRRRLGRPADGPGTGGEVLP